MLVRLKSLANLMGDMSKIALTILGKCLFDIPEVSLTEYITCHLP